MSFNIVQNNIIDSLFFPFMLSIAIFVNCNNLYRHHTQVINMSNDSCPIVNAFHMVKCNPCSLKVRFHHPPH